jgi:hypothetical protein
LLSSPGRTTAHATTPIDSETMAVSDHLVDADAEARGSVDGFLFYRLWKPDSPFFQSLLWPFLSSLPKAMYVVECGRVSDFVSRSVS